MIENLCLVFAFLAGSYVGIRIVHWLSPDPEEFALNINRHLRRFIALSNFRKSGKIDQNSSEID